ncbi:MAG: hypothetical protein M3464_13980 [Chloroflexota bacterium]|nr:hypothetical protein [Chloroflexota bacterium]
MNLVTEDKQTITIQFTRAEAANIRAAVNCVSSLFAYLDRDALDGWRMTMDDAERISEAFSNLTIPPAARFDSGASLQAS